MLHSCVHNKKKVPSKKSSINDRISIWLEASEDTSNSLHKRKQLLFKSYQAIKSSKIDTLKARHLSSIAYQNLKLGDTLLFKKQNKETLTIAEDLKATFVIGDVHWNYASYFNKKQVYDSAYYHFNLANIHFNKSGSIFESAKTQYGMAFIKGRFKDYFGSEVLTFKAIKKFKKIKNYKSLYSCYDHLSQLQNDIYEYDKSLFYSNKALEYLKKAKKTKTLIEASQNNIGNIYLKKKEYRRALKYYDRILENINLKVENPERYARVLDNKYYCQFLMKDTIDVATYLKEALRIKSGLKDKAGIIISKIRLGNYYAFKRDTSLAIKYVKEANILAKKIKNSRDYLESLSLLAIFDTKYSSTYLKTHIQFSDSLHIVERKNQNKFTRIAYETEIYIEETKRLAQQKIWILLTSLGLISTLGLFLFLKIQKSKTEKLLFENEQQKAIEKAYLITLKQQEKLEKEKIKERNRIAEELHDGVLGKLFGTRIGLGFLPIEGLESTKKKHQLLLIELQTIEREIREVSHKLITNKIGFQDSFASVIDQLIKDKCKINSFRYQLDFDAHIDWPKINKIIKVNLYRILQEALQNCIKHAVAQNITISFTLNHKNLGLIIKDDGIGFHLKLKRKGIGLKNMKSRTEKLDGIFHIDSKKNKGTIIKIKLPIK